MPAEVICPSCGSKLRIPDHLLGSDGGVKCPKCSTSIFLPAPVASTAADIERVWYVAKNQMRQGPFTYPQLQQLARSRQLSPTDMVWREGTAKWVRADSVDGLLPTLTPVPEPLAIGSIRHQWYYWKRNIRGECHGPVSGKQLQELAASGQVERTDLVSDRKDLPGCMEERYNANYPAHAYTLKGLFPEPGSVILEVYCPRVASGSRAARPVVVTLDDRVVETSTVGEGLYASFATTPERHTLGLRLLPSEEKQYAVRFPHSGRFQITLQLHVSFWRGVKCPDTCKVDPMRPPHEEGEYGLKAIRAWERERGSAQCPRCAAEWAVAFLGQEHVSRDYRIETVMQTEVHRHPNPTYRMPTAIGYDLLEFLESHTQRPVQVQVIYDTWVDVFQCLSCKEAWRTERVQRSIP